MLTSNKIDIPSDGAEAVVELFISFLEERNLRHIFDEYCLNRREMNSDDWLKANKRLPSAWISTCFSWSDTYEGHRFWSDLSFEWKKLYTEYRDERG